MLFYWIQSLFSVRIMLGGQNVAFLILNCVGKYNNHWALKDQYQYLVCQGPVSYSLNITILSSLFQ